MRKIIAFFLLLAMSLSCLSGCGNVNTKSDEQTAQVLPEDTE